MKLGDAIANMLPPDFDLSSLDQALSPPLALYETANDGGIYEALNELLKLRVENRETELGSNGKFR